MKIAFDGKRFFNNASGLGNYSRDLIRILASHYKENQYILLNKKTSERGKSILENSNVHFQKTSKGFLSRQFKMGYDSQGLEVDIFHGLSGELPLKWNSKPIKKIVTIHDLIFVRYPNYYSFFDRKIHFWKFKNAANIADKVIAISEQTKNDIVKFLKISPEKIDVVYQGCHESFKKPLDLELAKSLRKRFALPDRFILNVGTIEPRKNLLNLVKALTETNIPLVVVGKKTDYFKKVNQYVTLNKMQNQIIFLEGVSMNDLATLYKLADIMVYPSFFEGFGIPIIEALFSKTPVITSGVSSLPEAGGRGALYINPKDYLDIKSKINFLWNNNSERERLAFLGYEHVQKFNDSVIADAMMQIYTDVLKSKIIFAK